MSSSAKLAEKFKLVEKFSKQLTAYKSFSAVKNPSACVIFSHGLGDSWEGMEFLRHEFDRYPHIKWVFPNAPVQPVTCNMGMSMPSWFDIESFEETVALEEDEIGIPQASDFLAALVDEQITAGIPAHRIVVGGFSQGGIVSLYHSVASKVKLGGIISLSGYLPLYKTLKEKYPTYFNDVPIFMGIGTIDPVIKLKYTTLSSEYMKKDLGFSDVVFNSYKGLSHSINQQELNDMGKWLEKALPS